MTKKPKEVPLLIKLTDIIMKHGAEKEKVWFFSKFLPCAFIISVAKLYDTDEVPKELLNKI